MGEQDTVTPPSGYTLVQSGNAQGAQGPIMPPPGYKLLSSPSSAPSTSASTPDLTANPNREGVYGMTDANGHALGVPYSNVPHAQQGGYTLTSADSGRYAKDSQAATPRPPGFFSSAADASGLSTLGHALLHPLASLYTVADAAHRVIEPGQNPNLTYVPNPILSGIGRQIDRTKSEFGAAKEAAHEGEYGAAASHAAQAIPLAGSILSRAMEQSEEGANESYAHNLKNLVTNPGAMGTLVGGAASFAAPEAIKALPRGTARILSGGGDALEAGGEARMDRFLNGGRELPLNDSGQPMYDNPGRSVLESGPGTSIATSRRAMMPKVNAALTPVGRTINRIAMGSTGKVGTPGLWDSVNTVVDPMIEDATGPLGNQDLADRLEDMRESFTPTLGGKNYLSVPEGLQLKRLLDRNINRAGGFTDDTSNAANSAMQKIRAGVKNRLYDAEPALEAPSRRFSDLSDASKLLEDNQNARGPYLSRGRRLLAEAVIGAGTGYATHSPMAGLGTALASHAIPFAWNRPLTQTGLSTLAFQAGRGLNAAAPYIERSAPYIDRGIDALPPEARFLFPAAGAARTTRVPALEIPSRNSNGHADRDNQNGGQNNDVSHNLPPRRGSFSNAQIIRPKLLARRNGMR